MLMCPVCEIAIAPSPTAAGPFAGGTCSRECARAKVLADAAESLTAELPRVWLAVENLRLTLVEVR
jgi:hypothetical protein